MDMECNCTKPMTEQEMIHELEEKNKWIWQELEYQRKKAEKAETLVQNLLKLLANPYIKIENMPE